MLGTANEWLMVENDGELDLRLLELMGASTKDGKSTIGVFGTGWKYGLALALRKNIDVRIYSGRKRVRFTTRTETIRGEDFERIMIGSSAKPIRTSLTTAMGREDWNDEWMFLREIVSNAFDEGGFRMERLDVEKELKGKKNKTRVYLSITDRIVEVLDNMPYYIRRQGELEQNSYGKIFAPLGKKCRIYKRGIFVKELSEPGIHDYDLADLKLTESRSADHWDILWEIRKFLGDASNDVRRRVLVEQVQAKKEKRSLIESDLSWSSWDTDGNACWGAAFTEEFGEDAVLCSDSELVVESVKRAGHKPVTLPEKVAAVLRGMKNVLTENEVLDVGTRNGFIWKKEDLSDYQKRVLEEAQTSLEFLFGDGIKAYPIRVFNAEGECTDTEAEVLFEDDKYTLALNESVISAGLRKTTEVLYGEFLREATSDGIAAEKLFESLKVALFERVLPNTGVVL